VIYIADADNYRIWRLDPSGSAQVVAGSGWPGFSGDGGPAILASTGRVRALAVDDRGGLLVADPDHRRVRRVDRAGRIDTLAGVAYGGRPATEATSAAGADVGTPTGLAVGPDGTVYLADPSHGRVLAIGPGDTVRVVATRSARLISRRSRPNVRKRR
jgi:serine/threonine-protein kinase